MLTRGGIKPQIKKVQAILAINPPNNVKELRHFLGMVQYYRDMWAKRSEMLAPLSDLVGECGETKTTRKTKVKKKLWHWDSIHQTAFDNVKRTIAKEVVLAYPDFTKPFDIYVNPQMVTNTSWLWGIPKCDFFVSLPIPIRGLQYGNGETKWLIILIGVDYRSLE